MKYSKTMDPKGDIAKLTACENITQLAETVARIMDDTKTTTADLIEALRISETNFIVDQAALTLYKRTKRPRKPPEMDANWKSWYQYAKENFEQCVPKHERSHGMGNWTSYVTMLNVCGALK